MWLALVMEASAQTYDLFDSFDPAANLSSSPITFGWGDWQGATDNFHRFDTPHTTADGIQGWGRNAHLNSTPWVRKNPTGTLIGAGGNKYPGANYVALKTDDHLVRYAIVRFKAPDAGWYNIDWAARSLRNSTTANPAGAAFGIFGENNQTIDVTPITGYYSDGAVSGFDMEFLERNEMIQFQVYDLDGESTYDVVGVRATLEYDRDGDGVTDADDNCVRLNNPTQTDTDANGKGDACEVPYLTAADVEVIWQDRATGGVLQVNTPLPASATVDFGIYVSPSYTKEKCFSHGNTCHVFTGPNLTLTYVETTAVVLGQSTYFDGIQAFDQATGLDKLTYRMDISNGGGDYDGQCYIFGVDPEDYDTSGFNTHCTTWINSPTSAIP